MMNGKRMLACRRSGAAAIVIALSVQVGWAQIPASIHSVSSNLGDAAAFDRIADESGDKESKQKVNLQLAELVDQADALLARGDNSAAQVELDKAYHLLKVSIESKRAGQTLVRSLQFESKQEEYLYEVDRNDTHRMLISLLVDEKSKSDYTRTGINKFLEQAGQLRQQADAYAAQDEFVSAIDLLEQSTRQMVRAIRSAGIYIPG